MLEADEPSDDSPTELVSDGVGTDTIEQATSYAIKQQWFENQKVYSDGFDVYVVPIKLDDEEIARVWHIGYRFAYRQEQGVSNQFHVHETMFYGIGGIDNMVFQAEDTPLSSLRSLEHFFPDVMADVDVLVGNTKDEVEATLSLRDFTFPRRHESNDADTLYGIVKYLNDIVDFDDKLPYYLTVSGIIGIQKSDDEDYAMQIREDFEFAAYPEGFELMGAYAKDDAGNHTLDMDTLGFGLRVAILKKDRQLDGKHTILVPLACLQAMISLRERLFVSANAE